MKNCEIKPYITEIKTVYTVVNLDLNQTLWLLDVLNRHYGFTIKFMTFHIIWLFENAKLLSIAI